ncbi:MULTISPECIES: hypothetical protein [unclassified Agrobacterium]|uniref:hypothetical protein n=1 Tax=unclassified Agrobacterium TaxID=2632611 RepID=UPI00244A5676|nr:MULTISPECIES: hypothetical protein [unclassified Agrobacterium]MDH0612318.1 hypothetical protein [Agrobacterium sp. GD03872]MDH0696215.1 hypothetical protein [Agrobacterium sp. GD03871]MDH1059117.1 hypothetical protein [Agrobacterium sp. GD03992]MDH2210478.1 hypothetical protein [Agrobacterium sp. GD03643]MDH2217983.1 hypothetical protein [Agrobacterium sp. GD03638]
MSAVTTEASNDLRSRIVAVLREDRDVRNIGALADQLEAAIRSAEPVAWLRHGEETPVQNVPFGAMWISDKNDPRAFPVYESPRQPAPSVDVTALECARTGITIRLGIYGRAFDLPEERRAYTFEHQPGNNEAHKLGRACSGIHSGGDWIDRGLYLLQALQREGFGVYELPAAPAKQEGGTNG